MRVSKAFYKFDMMKEYARTSNNYFLTTTFHEHIDKTLTNTLFDENPFDLDETLPNIIEFSSGIL